MGERQPTLRTEPPASWDLAAIYGVIAELLLNPVVRDEARIARALSRVGHSVVRERIERFLESPRGRDIDEYTQTLELAPPCPLYLGSYSFDEPGSCLGAGTSGRNTYMIEVAAVYQHFGFSLDDRELPDFVPVVVEFLAVSLDVPERDTIGLRRRFVEKYVLPPLPSLRKGLRKYESVYDLLIAALEVALHEDLERMLDDPVWLEPEVRATIPERPPGPSSADTARGGAQR